MVKILYTTAGPYDALDGPDDDRLEVEKANERKAQRASGHARKGRIVLNVDVDDDDDARDNDPYEIS